MKKIHELLKNWGKSAHRLPSQNEELKKNAFAALANSARIAPATAYRSRWPSFALAGMAIVLLLVNKGEAPMPIRIDDPIMRILPAPMAEKGGAFQMETMQAPARLSIAPDYFPRPWPDQNIPITDTRELFKTDYNVTIRTRSVQTLTRRVATTVRGFGGRVDNTSDSREWGYINFVVPAVKFDAFAREIENLVGARFIIINTRTENLLPQKRSIEEQQTQIKKSITDASADRKKLIANHDDKVFSLKTQISTAEDALALLKAEQTTDPVRKAQIAAGIQKLIDEQLVLQARLANENASYARQLNVFDEQLRNFESSLSWVETQDKNLLDIAATVHGSINVSWISLWEIVQLYISVEWMAGLLMAAAVVWHLRPIMAW